MFDQVLEEINKQAQNVAPLGGTLKFNLDGNILYIDGSGDANVVSTEDKESDTTITTSIETLMKLKSGDLNPMMAVMTQKVKISGNMGLAMKLQSLV